MTCPNGFSRSPRFRFRTAIPPIAGERRAAAIPAENSGYPGSSHRFGASGADEPAPQGGPSAGQRVRPLSHGDPPRFDERGDRTPDDTRPTAGKDLEGKSGRGRGRTRKAS